MSSNLFKSNKLDTSVIQNLDTSVITNLAARSLNSTINKLINDEAAEENLIILIKVGSLIIIAAITLIFGFLPLLW
jgi:hypothetical protein